MPWGWRSSESTKRSEIANGVRMRRREKNDWGQQTQQYITSDSGKKVLWFCDDDDDDKIINSKQPDCCYHYLKMKKKKDLFTSTSFYVAWKTLIQIRDVHVEKQLHCGFLFWKHILFLHFLLLQTENRSEILFFFLLI